MHETAPKPPMLDADGLLSDLRKSANPPWQGASNGGQCRCRGQERTSGPTSTECCGFDEAAARMPRKTKALGRVLIKQRRSEQALLDVGFYSRSSVRRAEADLACHTDSQFALTAGGGVHEPSVISTFGQ